MDVLWYIKRTKLSCMLASFQFSKDASNQFKKSLQSTEFKCIKMKFIFFDKQFTEIDLLILYDSCKKN